jgi:hypothetical protein
MSTRNFAAHYEGIDGGMLIYWMVQNKSVLKFIKENEIPPVDRELLPIMNAGAEAETRTAERALFIKPFPFPGGIMVPHLHYKRDLYLLTPDQWKKFSDEAMKRIREKMERAETVGFNQFMKISEAVHSL